MSRRREKKSASGGATGKTLKLSPELKDLIGLQAARVGQPQAEFVRRMMVWFSRRTDLVQDWVLGLHAAPPDEFAAQLKELVERVKAQAAADQRKELGNG